MLTPHGAEKSHLVWKHVWKFLDTSVAEFNCLPPWKWVGLTDALLMNMMQWNWLCMTSEIRLEKTIQHPQASLSCETHHGSPELTTEKFGYLEATTWRKHTVRSHRNKARSCNCLSLLSINQQTCECRIKVSPMAQQVKNPPVKQETWVWFLGWEDPLEKEMAPHSSILAWEILWTEEPGRLQSLGSQRLRYDWVTKCMRGSRINVNLNY